MGHTPRRHRAQVRVAEPLGRHEDPAQRPLHRLERPVARKRRGDRGHDQTEVEVRLPPRRQRPQALLRPARTLRQLRGEGAHQARELGGGVELRRRPHPGFGVASQVPERMRHRESHLDRPLQRADAIDREPLVDGEPGHALQLA